MAEVEMNPYQSGNFEPSSVPSGSVRRPTGLLIFCVIILAVASMGFLGGVIGGVALGINGGKTDYKQQMGGSGSGVDINPEALKKLEAYGPAHSAKNLGLTIVGLLVSVFLIVGAVAAIYPIRSGATLLTIACVAAILYLIAQGVIVMTISQDVLTVLKEYPDDFFTPKDKGMDENAVRMIGSIMRGTYTFMPIVVWILNVLKIVFYVAVVMYLRKRNVRQFVQGTAS